MNAGIYILSCKATGASFIGASKNLDQRRESHLSSIRRRKGTPAFLSAFPSTKRVVFGVLERIEIPELDITSIESAKPHFEACDRLLERERHWIVKVQPTLNIRKREPEAFTMTIGIPMEPDDKRRLRNAAKAAGLTLAEYCRRAIVAGLERDACLAGAP